MDVCDEAAQIESFQLREALRNQNSKTKLRPTGYCHYCGEKIKNDVLFCSKECRDDYEYEEQIKRRQGLKS